MQILQEIKANILLKLEAANAERQAAQELKVKIDNEVDRVKSKDEEIKLRISNI